MRRHKLHFGPLQTFCPSQTSKFLEITQSRAFNTCIYLPAKVRPPIQYATYPTHPTMPKGRLSKNFWFFWGNFGARLLAVGLNCLSIVMLVNIKKKHGVHETLGYAAVGFGSLSLPRYLLLTHGRPSIFYSWRFSPWLPRLFFGSLRAST